MRSGRSLSLVVTCWAAAGIAAGMAAYAAVQWYFDPRTTVVALTFRHLWHVAALGAVVYGVCWFGIRRVLVRPLVRLQRQLYGVATGRVEPVSLGSSITEIRSLEEGVNLMVRRLRRDAGFQAHAELLERTAAMRDVVYSLLAEEPLVASPLLDELAHLEGALLALAPRPTEARAAAIAISSARES